MGVNKLNENFWFRNSCQGCLDLHINRFADISGRVRTDRTLLWLAHRASTPTPRVDAVLAKQANSPRFALAPLRHQFARLARVEIRNANIVDHVVAKQAFFKEVL
jgi:hypothetical protein